MQKLRKALKKLAGLGNKSTPQKRPSAAAAKKSAPVKKKTQLTASAKKTAAKKPAKIKAKPVAKAAGKAPVKMPVKTAANVSPKETKKISATPAGKQLNAALGKNVAKSSNSSDLKTPTTRLKGATPRSAAKSAIKAENISQTKATNKDANEKANNKAVAKKAADESKNAKKAAATGKSLAAPAPIAGENTQGAKGRKGRDVEIKAEAGADEEIVLTDAEGRRYCRVKDCDQLAAVDLYCRYHYLLFWKNIQNRKKILAEGKLDRYIEELTARYPDKYLEMLRKDLRSEKEFTAAIQELEIDEAGMDSEFEDESQGYLDEVRGMSSEAPATTDDEF